MRTTTLRSACATIGLLACTAKNGPTEPEASGTMGPADPAVAAAVNIWREWGPHNLGTAMGPSVGVLTNSAGQSVVHVFGGCDAEEGDFGHAPSPASAATTWRRIRGLVMARSWYPCAAPMELAQSAASCTPRGAITFRARDRGVRRAWAYDPATRRVTQLADMPKLTAEGVTGVIGGKLYVLPGNCDDGLEQQSPSAGSTATIPRRTSGELGGPRPTSTGWPRAGSSAASSTSRAASRCNRGRSRCLRSGNRHLDDPGSDTQGRPGHRGRAGWQVVRRVRA